MGAEEIREGDDEGNYSPESQSNEQLNEDSYSDPGDTDNYNNDGSSAKHTDDTDDILVDAILDSATGDNYNNEGSSDDDNYFVEASKHLLVHLTEDKLHNQYISLYLYISMHLKYT